MTTTTELKQYYADLLTLQYKGKPRAYETVKAVVQPLLMPQTSEITITLSKIPLTGSFDLRYGAASVTTINVAYSATASSIQANLRTLSGLSAVTVSGSPAEGFITVKMLGVTPVSELLYASNVTMQSIGSVPVTVSILETDKILPLAVQDAFNILPGFTPAVGTQLEVLGKYAGVKRNGRGFSTFLTLSDSDFLLLIKMAIGRNSAQSDLASIDQFLSDFFPGQIFVYDYDNMHLGYFIAPGSISSDLLQAFIGQGLLPKPMGVTISPIIYSVNNELLFGFNTYTTVNPYASPFNSYTNYSQTVTWLTYAYIVVI